MNNRHRRPRYTQPIDRRHRHAPRPGAPEGLYSFGFYDPDGEEIEITIDVNDPTADPVLLDLMHLLTDNCPYCIPGAKEDGHGQ